MGIYGRWIYPHVTNVMNKHMARYPDTVEMAGNLAGLAEGTVLEIGIGSGGGLGMYDASKVSKVYGLDPHPRMIRMASVEAAKAEFDVELLQVSAEEIPLPDHGVDTVLTMATFCTIPDLHRALGEIRRVLRDEGKLVFFEHGIAPDARVQRWQRLEEPLHKWMFQGCHLTRNIPRSMQEGGFEIRDMNQGYIRGFPKSWAYCCWGFAVKG